jgi:hypothetical protein
MGLKAHQMDVETPTGGRDRSEGLHRKGRRRSTRSSLADLYPGGLCPFHQDVGLGRPMTSPKTPYDVIQRLWRFWEAVMYQVARAAGSGGPRRPNVLLQVANVSLRGPNVTLTGHGVITFA